MRQRFLDVGVAPGRRRRGVGRALVSHAAEVARSEGAQRLFLEVAEDNEAAHALYARGGFEQVGRRPGYYRRSGEGRVDALILALAL